MKRSSSLPMRGEKRSIRAAFMRVGGAAAMVLTAMVLTLTPVPISPPSAQQPAEEPEVETKGIVDQKVEVKLK